MRLPIVFAAIVAAATVGVSLLSSIPTAEAYGGKCLRFRDILSMSKLDDRTLLARTRSSQKYLVTFRHACRDYGRPGNYYKVRLYGDYECFDRDDVLVFRDGGACFIESVKPAPANVAG